MTKQLFRSVKNKMIGGVAGGLSEYFDVDPVIIRVIFVVTGFAWGVSILIYIGLWIFVPVNPEQFDYMDDVQEINDYPEENFTTVKDKKTERQVIAGVILMVVGMLIIIDKFFPWFELKHIWPLILVAGGGYIIYKAIQSKN